MATTGGGVMNRPPIRSFLRHTNRRDFITLLGGAVTATCGARALARPDAASDSSLREFVEFRERSARFSLRPAWAIALHPSAGSRTQRLKRVHGYASRAYPMSGGCKESSAECTAEHDSFVFEVIVREGSRSVL